MHSITFNPGPSQITSQVYNDIRHACDEKLLEISHRSPRFNELSEKTITELAKYLELPDGYEIFYTSSAHQGWEQALLSTTNIQTEKTFHIGLGSFSEKWAKIADRLGYDFGLESVPYAQAPDYQNIEVPSDVTTLCVCHNETSTGVRMRDEDLVYLRSAYPEQFIAVDITSSAGAVKIDFSLADAWLFSVQKAFGLPAGLGILIVNQRVLEKARSLQSINPLGAFGLPYQEEKMRTKFQTPATPNVLSIFLLGEQCERWNKIGGIQEIERQTDEKYAYLECLVKKSEKSEFLVKNPAVRSRTVMALRANEEIVKQAHTKASEHNIILGSGYGDFKSTGIRIANFPSVGMKDFKILEKILYL